MLYHSVPDSVLCLLKNNCYWQLFLAIILEEMGYNFLATQSSEEHVRTLDITRQRRICHTNAREATSQD